MTPKRDVRVSATGSPTLDWVIKQGIPRELWAVEWLAMNYGEIPGSITAEELSDVVPPEIADELALLYFDQLGAIHFDIPDELIQTSTETKQ